MLLLTCNSPYPCPPAFTVPFSIHSKFTASVPYARLTVVKVIALSITISLRNTPGNPEVQTQIVIHVHYIINIFGTIFSLHSLIVYWAFLNVENRGQVGAQSHFREPSFCHSTSADCRLLFLYHAMLALQSKRKETQQWIWIEDRIARFSATLPGWIIAQVTSWAGSLRHF